jgi:hypothetical protein
VKTSQPETMKIEKLQIDPLGDFTEAHVEHMNREL